MMMAHDATPPRPQLDRASIHALEVALQNYVSGATDPAALEPALRAVAIEAREKRIQAEHLLLLLKDIWYGLPQIRALPEGPEQNRLLQRVVTFCIREYYSPTR